MHKPMILILAAISFGIACKKEQKAGGSSVLARVGDRDLTVADLQAKVARYGKSPYLVARYSQPEKKRELLEDIIQSEILAQEARRRGYDQDPAVLREMVNRMLQAEIDVKIKPEEIADAEVDKYYREHLADFSRADQVRVSQILVKDRAKAMKALAEAKALPKVDGEKFRSLVTKFSEDEETRARGGNLGVIEQGSATFAKQLVEAAFSLREPGDISDPVQTVKGYVILRLNQRVPGYSRSLVDAKSDIQLRLASNARKQRREALLAEIRKSAKVEIREGELEKVQLSFDATSK